MSNKWLSIIRRVASVSPPTGFPLFRPVLTQELSLSPLTIRAEPVSALSAAQREYEARAAARGRSIRKATYWSTFVTYTVHSLCLASCTRRSRDRSHVPDDHPLALRRVSPPHDMLQIALARHCPTTAARVPLLPPTQESTFVTCCPRPPHGMKWKPPGEPS